VQPDLSLGRRPVRLLVFLRLYAGPFFLGALAVLGFAPFGLYVIPVLSLTCLLLMWRDCVSSTAAALVGFTFGAGMFVVGVSWVYVSLHVYGGMVVPVAAVFTLLFCLIQACYPALVGAVLMRSRASFAAKYLLLFPALWVFSEWLRSWVLSGFPWLSIGYSQVPASPLAGFAPVLGTFGVSLVTAIIAGAIATTVDIWFRRSTTAAGKAFFFPLGTAIGVAGALLIAGVLLKHHQWTEPLPGEPTTVTLLQGNIPQELKWRPERAQATLQTYLELVRSTDSKLILLPETALPVLNIDIPSDYVKAFTDRALLNGGDMLFGVPERDPSGRYYNSVMSLGMASTQIYRKHHLVPFGDFFPLQSVLGWIMRLLHIPMSDFSHGAPVQRPLQVAGQKVAVNICYEDAFGEEIIRQLPEATVLANFTNDAWWGDTIASRQHLQIAQMRALETGRPMLRATNTGVTAIIDPAGHVVASAPEFTTTKLSGTVRGYQGSTPYVRMGNAGVLLLAGAMILVQLLVARVRLYRKR
jgi:apolipoprotein N-acyltransferase